MKHLLLFKSFFTLSDNYGIFPGLVSVLWLLLIDVGRNLCLMVEFHDIDKKQPQNGDKAWKYSVIVRKGEEGLEQQQVLHLGSCACLQPKHRSPEDVTAACTGGYMCKLQGLN